MKLSTTTTIMILATIGPSVVDALRTKSRIAIDIDDIQRSLMEDAMMPSDMDMSMPMDGDMDGDMDDGMGMSMFDIKLTPGNEIDPFVGIENAFGTAQLTIHDDKACIETNIDGFQPGSAHIHFGEIDMNGPIVVDFTSLIEPMHPDTKGCVDIQNETLVEELMNNPHLYYVNVHAGPMAPEILFAIRGQLVQGFTATLENGQTVAPFDETVEGASGMAMVSFEDAGKTACYDVSISVDDFMFGHVHNAVAGMNGPRIFNYTELMIAPGRFLGCQDVTSDDIEGDVDAVKAILADPSMYYFDYHITLTQPVVLTSIRGQFMSAEGKEDDHDDSDN